MSWRAQTVWSISIQLEAAFQMPIFIVGAYCLYHSKRTNRGPDPRPEWLTLLVCRLQGCLSSPPHLRSFICHHSNSRLRLHSLLQLSPSRQIYSLFATPASTVDDADEQ